MKNTTERRQAILDYLLEHKKATRNILASRFNVSLRTIERDVLILSCSYPIDAVQGGGGGIYISDGFKLGMKYFTDEQAALLEKLSEGLTNEELVIMKSILKTFRRPVVVK